jgi:hypothetical protein
LYLYDLIEIITKNFKTITGDKYIVYFKYLAMLHIVIRGPNAGGEKKRAANPANCFRDQSRISLQKFDKNRLLSEPEAADSKQTIAGSNPFHCPKIMCSGGERQIRIIIFLLKWIEQSMKSLFFSFSVFSHLHITILNDGVVKYILS